MSKNTCVKVALAPALRVHVSLRPCGKPSTPGGSAGGAGGSTGGNTGGGETVTYGGFSDNSGALLADDSGAILV